MSKLTSIKIKTLLLSIFSLFFISCGTTSSNELDRLKNATLAKANSDTALKFLGTSYTLDGTPTNSTIKYRSETYIFNPYSTKKDITYNRDINGTKNYSFFPEPSNKSFKQTFDYKSYKNESYDSICDKYRTENYNGIINCVGNYSNVIDNKYYIKNKTCVYDSLLTSTNISYEKGGTKTYDYENNIYEKNYIYKYFNDTRAKQNWKYYYKKDENTTTYQTYVISGKLYFDNLSKYVEIDNSYNAKNNTLKFDLCNDSVYNGSMQIITKDNIKMKFTTIQTNKVIVEKSSDNTNWELVGTFTR